MPRLPPGAPRKPKHEAGQSIYIALSTYDPATYKKKHRGTITLKRWPIAEVRQIIIDAFTARQVKTGDQDPIDYTRLTPPEERTDVATHTKSQRSRPRRVRTDRS